MARYVDLQLISYHNLYQIVAVLQRLQHFCTFWQPFLQATLPAWAVTEKPRFTNS